MRDDFSKMPCLCGFQGGQVRDEKFFENLFLKIRIGYFVRVMSMSRSDYVYKVFD